MRGGEPAYNGAGPAAGSGSPLPLPPSPASPTIVALIVVAPHHRPGEHHASPHPLPDHRRSGPGDPRRRAVRGSDHRALPGSDRRAGAAPSRVHGDLPGPGARAGPGRRYAARGRRGSRSVARHPLRGQGSLRRGGPAHHRGHPPPRRQRPGPRLHGRQEAGAGRDGAARQDDHRAVRLRRRGHQHRPGDPAQPLASRAPPSGRIELRHRGRGGGGDGADGTGLRHRRIGPDPREHVWGYRSEDDGGTGEPCGHLPAEPEPRQRRTVDPRRGRRRASSTKRCRGRIRPTRPPVAKPRTT